MSSNCALSIQYCNRRIPIFSAPRSLLFPQVLIIVCSQAPFSMMRCRQTAPRHTIAAGVPASCAGQRSDNGNATCTVITHHHKMARNESHLAYRYARNSFPACWCLTPLTLAYKRELTIFRHQRQSLKTHWQISPTTAAQLSEQLRSATRQPCHRRFEGRQYASTAGAPMPQTARGIKLMRSATVFAPQIVGWRIAYQ